MKSKFVAKVRSESHAFWRERGIFFYFCDPRDVARAYGHCVRLNMGRGLESPPNPSNKASLMLPMDARDFDEALRYCQSLDKQRKRLPTTFKK